MVSRFSYRILLFQFILSTFGVFAQENVSLPKTTGYLFTYFTSNGAGGEAIRFALSKDGYNYYALNNNRPVLESSVIASSGGVRDPHILRGADGKTFYMVATDMVAAKGWDSNRAMVLLKSTDLINWTSHVVNIQTRFPVNDSLKRVWAPQTIYDAKRKKYMIYFSMKHGSEPDKIYYAYANEDFSDLATKPKQLFFKPDKGACIDGDIIQKDGQFHLFFKTEDALTGIRQAVSKKLTGKYTLLPGTMQQTKEAVEGAGVFKLNNEERWILMYDVYKKGQYQFTSTTDLEHFNVIDQDVTMDFHPRHGTVMAITEEETERLVKQWYRPFKDSLGQSMVSYKLAERGPHNPALKGSYADPEILYAEKNKKFYMYPTSDGFTDWAGTYFKAFSSKDLVSWKDEGVILDLPKQVGWAQKNAWAPCIIEKKINGQYKYFYYFVAAQKIGVAVADDPLGPFKDLGKPLIDHYPDGIRRGQQIDPDVFTDPRTGKTYLYWGNGYLAGAELNDDMVSLKDSTLKILTPVKSYNEGAYVFYRNHRYYFMWSEHDTRSPDYQVRYGISESPLGAITVPENNIVLAKDTATGILGTGHNSVVQIPGKDEWYIVYHRFMVPFGVYLGRAAGYNREVCIDPLYFEADGSIRRVKPTLKGIEGVKEN